jgi:hypothetical protein
VEAHDLVRGSENARLKAKRKKRTPERADKADLGKARPLGRSILMMNAI